MCDLQRLRFDAGADIMLAPSAFAVSTGALVICSTSTHVKACCTC